MANLEKMADSNVDYAAMQKWVYQQQLKEAKQKQQEEAEKQRVARIINMRAIAYANEVGAVALGETVRYYIGNNFGGDRAQYPELNELAVELFMRSTAEGVKREGVSQIEQGSCEFELKQVVLDGVRYYTAKRIAEYPRNGWVADFTRAEILKDQKKQRDLQIKRAKEKAKYRADREAKLAAEKKPEIALVSKPKRAGKVDILAAFKKESKHHD